MRIEFEGQIHEFPDDFTDEEIRQALQGDTLAEDTLDVVGEFANAANRGVTETLDFLGPGTANAALRMAGVDYQLPTFTGKFEEHVPGAEGGFMDPGTGRDVVRAAGATLPATGSMVTAPGRNVASIPGAAAELTGFGAAAPISGVADEAADLAARADAINWPLSPGDRFDSGAMKRAEAAIESTPMPFNPMHRMQRIRQDAVNEAAAESIGVPGKTRLTQETMGNVADDLGGEFKRLEMEEDLIVGQKFQDDLADIEATAGSRVFKTSAIPDAIDGIMDKIGESGRLSAIDYQNLSSEFKAKIRQAFRGENPDPQFAESLSEIVRALDDLAEDNLDGAALARLREARRKWRSFQALEKSRAVKESGDVSGPLLANYLRRTDKGGYARGKNTGELYETARMSKAFPSQPDSGTASRMMLQSLLAHPFAALGGGFGTGAGLATMMSPEAMIGMATGAAAVPAAANAYFYGMPMLRRGMPPLAPRAGLQANLAGRLFEEE